MKPLEGVHLFWGQHVYKFGILLYIFYSLHCKLNLIYKIIDMNIHELICLIIGFNDEVSDACCWFPNDEVSDKTNFIT